MCSHDLKLVRRLLFCAVRLVTFVSPSASITGGGIGTLNFVYNAKPVIFAGWQNVELFAILSWHRPNHSVETASWWQELEKYRLHCLPKPSIFAFHSSYILLQNSPQELVLRILTLAFVVCTFISCLDLACAGTSP